MNPQATLIEILEPRAVMAVGCCVAFLIGCIVSVHAHFAKLFREPLIALAAAMALASASFFFSVVQFLPDQAMAALLAPVSGTLSYFAAAVSTILLYRPTFSRNTFAAIAVACLLGFSLCADAASIRNWNNICQFALAALIAAIVWRTDDPQAPHLRLVCIGLSAFSMLGMTPRLIAIATGGADAAQLALPVDTAAYRIRALVWTMLPPMIYACVTGVIQARVARRLIDISELDAMTGAYTRRYLFEAGEKVLKSSTPDALAPAKLLLIDEDNFKDFNDNWGHKLGDEMLRHCVDCIRSVVRADDAVIGRYGGEEFCVLLPGIEPEAADLLAERIRGKIASNPYQQGERKMSITVSIGVAQHQEFGSLNSMINLADERLYRAKSSGRNCIVGDGHSMLPV